MQTPPRPAPDAPSTAPPPTVRTVAISQSMQWLVLAWKDMAACGWLSFVHGLAMVLAGALILWVAHDRFWLMAGALSGFLVVAPVLATSLYAMSRALERGEPVSVHLVLATWVKQNHGPRGSWRKENWPLIQLGALLTVAATVWVVASAALITLLSPVPINAPIDFVRYVLLAKDSYLFEVWMVMGGAMAAPIFASTVVAMPLLLDRRITLKEAVLTSWRVVLTNPAAMAFWALLLAGFTLLGLGTALLGLVAVVPMLGHASWHAYRELVDASGLPERDAVYKVER